MEINKYQNSKIYKIVSLSNPDLVYYGSTIVNLCKRMSQHRALSNKTSSKQIIELGNAIILLVELYPCNSKEELNRREGEFILNNVCVNKMVAGRTRKESLKAYYELNKDKDKEYKLKNKDTIKKRMKEYYENNKDKYKEYIKNNRDHINTKQRERRLLNKDKIKD